MGIGPPHRPASCGDQRFDPDDIYYSGQIVGQDREGHLGDFFSGRVWVRPCVAHARLYGAKRMFDGLAT